MHIDFLEFIATKFHICSIFLSTLYQLKIRIYTMF